MFQPQLGWPFQFLIFGALSLITIVGWLRWSKGRGETPTDSPFLNKRVDRFIGKEAVLSEPIRNGSGRVALDDSVWRIAGPDLGAGQRIRIVGQRRRGAEGRSGLARPAQFPGWKPRQGGVESAAERLC